MFRSREKIQIMYTVMLIVWLSIIFFCGLWKYPFIVPLFALLIPIVVFMYSIYSADCFTENSDAGIVMNSQYLIITIVIMIPLLTWFLQSDHPGSSREVRIFITVILVAMITILITMIDIWLPEKYIVLYKHFRSCCKVIAVSLIIFLLPAIFLFKNKNLQ
jgi:hypothetical protein